MSDETQLAVSTERLGEELDKVHTGGASIPELQALEEAVTLNLSGLSILLASQILADCPELKEHLQSIDFCWTLQNEVSHLAMIIREYSSALDAAFQIKGGDLETQPGESFRSCVALLQMSANYIQVKGEQAIDETAGGAMGKMSRARHFLNDRYS
jgi:hypothetical protein